MPEASATPPSPTGNGTSRASNLHRKTHQTPPVPFDRQHGGYSILKLFIPAVQDTFSRHSTPRRFPPGNGVRPPGKKNGAGPGVPGSALILFAIALEKYQEGAEEEKGVLWMRTKMARELVR